MRVWVSPYQLESAQRLNSQSNNLVEGCLLKIETIEGMIGFSCLQTWPTLGEPRYADLLYNFKEGGLPHPLLLRALNLAQKDATAFSEKRELFTETQTFRQHKMLNLDFSKISENFQFESQIQSRNFQLGELIEKSYDEGFERIKLKTGFNPRAEAEILAKLTDKNLKNGSLRLDFNGVGAVEFLNHFPALLDSKVAFLEDPFPCGSKLWMALNIRRHLPLYLDRNKPIYDQIENQRCSLPSDLSFIRGLVIKPICEEIPNLRENLPLVFTSNMEHPFGQWIGLCEMAEYVNSLRNNPDATIHRETLFSGFLTHELFRKTKYHESFSLSDGAISASSSGYGYGHRDLLNNESWVALENF